VLKSLRRFDSIAEDETLSPAESMEAERNRADVVIHLAKMEVEGPRIVQEGLLTSNPVAVSWGGGSRLDVFARDRHGRLHHKFWPNNNNEWSEWNVHAGVLDILDS
jgi:hypothetical protein